MNHQGKQPQRRSNRRWFQFSLRTLLLAVTAIALLGWPLNRYREHARAVAAIRALDGIVNATAVGPQWLREVVGEDCIARVYAVQLLPNHDTWMRKFMEQGGSFYSGERPCTEERDPNDDDLRLLQALPEIASLNLSYTEIGDGGIRHLAGMTKLHSLDLTYTNVTDRGIEHLEEFHHLHTLYLGRTHITDEGVEHLKALGQLRALSLADTQVSDAGLEHLRNLTNLDDLRLDKTAITDAGLAHLERMDKLETLSLVGTGVTDAGLLHLKELHNLRYLWLHGTEVTDVGMADLQKALPDCAIWKAEWWFRLPTDRGDGDMH